MIYFRSDYPTKKGSVFTRWSTPGSNPSYYGPNQKVTLTEDLTLYASFVDKASGSEGISVVGPDGQKEMEFNEHAARSLPPLQAVR
ncbi:MAG: InlB B-repeat-containing protein [Eubacteriaceae bacterium]|nr:InlB B-repeat-containing protein [Eubacteriaceae bacterium]